MYLVFRSFEPPRSRARRGGAQRPRGVQVGVARSTRRAAPPRGHRPARLDRRGRPAPHATCARCWSTFRRCPPHEPSWWATMSDRVRTCYLEWTGTRSFVAVVDAMIVVLAAATAAECGARSRFDDSGIHGFTDWCAVISAGSPACSSSSERSASARSRIDGLRVVRTRAPRRDPRDAGVHLPAAPARGLVGSDRGIVRLAARPFRDARRDESAQPGRRGQTRERRRRRSVS